MFGKLKNGNLTFAPKTITIESRVHYHPKAELYMQLGYLEVIDTPYPQIEDETEPPKYYRSEWIEQEGKIIKVWTETDCPEPKTYTPTTEERLTIIETNITETQLALCEVYELLEGGTDNGQDIC